MMENQTPEHYTPQPMGVPPQTGGDVKPLLSMIFGIASIVLTCCYGFGIVFAIPALILAALSKTGHNSGFKTTGLITGIIGLLLSLVMIGLMAIGFAAIYMDELWYMFY